MSQEISGVPLSDLYEPVHDALEGYAHYSDGRLSFDSAEAAIGLELVGDEKGYSARSSTPILLHGEPIGDLVVLGFAPGDGTGDHSTYTTGQIVNPHFPDESKYFPRSKANLHSEAHLTLVAQEIDSQADPTLFAGHLSILGLVGNRITEIGYVGQDAHSFASDVSKRRKSHPKVTLTTGYRGVIHDESKPGERFADPHSLVNRNECVVQVAGFIAIKPLDAARNLAALRYLNAQDPILGRF